jgi:hypothetical protein
MQIPSWVRDHLGDVWVNIAANGLWVAAGSTITYTLFTMRHLLRKRRAGYLWHGFLSDTLVVIGSHADFYNWEATGLTGVGDIKALGSVLAKLRDLGAKSYSMKFDSTLEPQDWNRNLIFIGGAGANAGTRTIAPQISQRIRFASVIENNNRRTGCVDSARTDGPTMDTDWIGSERNQEYEDYGVIMLAPNPGDSRRQVMILAGGTGAGTQKAAMLASDQLWGSRRKTATGISFYVRVANETPAVPYNVITADL